ncbi:hypothetical protein GCM10010360_25500 [Streptomyces nogalater]
MDADVGEVRAEPGFHLLACVVVEGTARSAQDVVDGGALYGMLCLPAVAVGAMPVFFPGSWVSGPAEHLDDCRVADAAL